MARTIGTEAILEAATQWRDRCLLADGSVFTEEFLWVRPQFVELEEHFINNPDEGDRSFLEKLKDQISATPPETKQVTGEMLWVMMLFPSNITQQRKVELVATVWGWSGKLLPRNHPMLTVLAHGIGSGGMGYNSYQPFELQFFVRLMLDWKVLDAGERVRLLANPWAFAEFVDKVEGADRRQFRHMLLHLLFPDSFERVSSGNNKARIDKAFESSIGAAPLSELEAGNTLLARDRRLFRLRRQLEAERPGKRLDFYQGDLLLRWNAPEAPRPPEAPPVAPTVRERTAIFTVPTPQSTQDTSLAPTSEFDLATVTEALQALGLRISERTVRRYHLALSSRGFVILSGVSGTGKTWVAEAYARTIGARPLVVPVAPNWTSNEDLLGFADPFGGVYRDTEFSRFLRDAAAEHADARRDARPARQFHLILDEMNLARVEYYFAKFLSAMEQRMRDGEARIELSEKDKIMLTPNLKFIGTVNVDETTHGFADKVYDRAHLIEMTASREAIEEHLGAAPYRAILLQIWDTVLPVAPFAFRVLDDIRRYVEAAKTLNVPWEELFDEVVLQKILTKIRGTDPRIGDALVALDDITTQFPLSNGKIKTMRAGFEQHGVVSFF
jgi:AAA domain (dynein-related subfamily)